ncbi:hypothetical protein RRG08_050817 [Elysia crispata]|uniref:Uncharacterized protein n=1 Tax=Elysia crispata TaxID=231223 RepID=A0AAE1AEJ8_9GAST|nr:hypothetical protein RRG08_050817 [Elysia crispata]
MLLKLLCQYLTHYRLQTTVTDLYNSSIRQPTSASLRDSPIDHFCDRLKTRLSRVCCRDLRPPTAGLSRLPHSGFLSVAFGWGIVTAHLVRCACVWFSDKKMQLALVRIFVQ